MLRRYLPNILTLSNLSLGVLAILVAASTDKENLGSRGDDVNLIYFSCLFIMIAALTDRLDGKLARRLGATSDLGKQLDSLSDLISFGVAPAVIAWKLNFAFASQLMPMGQIPGYLVALLFPMAGAIRLARYNLQDDPDFFQGIPITLAGSILTLLNLFNTFMFLKDRFNWLNALSCLILMMVLSGLMVSKIPIRKI